uniref:Uncharacterized protein n=1 Tax=Arundo donax TaxID=35708 RepID=A0A0A8Y982_ARUDO
MVNIPQFPSCQSHEKNNQCIIYSQKEYKAMN